jgi:hypothetical protein
VTGRDWRTRSLADLLAEHRLVGLPEHEFPTDGWSGARFSMIERRARPGIPPERFVLKRTSLATDWIAAATDDAVIREAWLANVESGPPTAYLGAASDGTEAAILMPDLSVELLAWERPGHDVVADPGVVQRVIEGLAILHSGSWPVLVDGAEHGPPGDPAFPWCPLPERLTLTARQTCLRHIERGIPAGVESARKLLAGWDAFDRSAPAAARHLVAELGGDPTPLVVALRRLPFGGLHGDVKLANVAIGPDDAFRLIDWQMTLRAPVAVELGWFIVTNSAALPEPPDRILERYRRAALLVEAARTSSGEHPPMGHISDWDAQVDLARIVGLLLRGWRKGLDAEAGATLGSGVGGADDLAEWCSLAVEAAARRL